MRNSTGFKILSLLFAVLLIVGCSSTKEAKQFNGMGSPDGKVIEHLSTNNLAIHWLFGATPAWGNASLEKTVDDFTAAAKTAGASKVRIVQSSVNAMWYLLPPITFFVTPVSTNVAGEALS